MSEPDGRDRLVRPYVLTGGRTRSKGALLPIEALVSATGTSTAGGTNLSHEERLITMLCQHWTISVAEVAARIDVPLGVARVLIGDLAHQGLLEVGDTSDRPDVALLKEVLHGLLAE
jgi:hypothetical protein